VSEILEMWFHIIIMLLGQIKPEHIYYDNPGLIVFRVGVGRLTRQLVSPQEF
jgi:hypothetical protein